MHTTNIRPCRQRNRPASKSRLETLQRLQLPQEVLFTCGTRLHMFFDINPCYLKHNIVQLWVHKRLQLSVRHKNLSHKAPFLSLVISQALANYRQSKSGPLWPQTTSNERHRLSHGTAHAVVRHQRPRSSRPAAAAHTRASQHGSNRHNTSAFTWNLDRML